MKFWVHRTLLNSKYSKSYQSSFISYLNKIDTTVTTESLFILGRPNSNLSVLWNKWQNSKNDIQK